MMSHESRRDLPLRESGLLTDEQVGRLGAHWVTTLEQLLVLGASAARRRSGAELMGMEAAAFDDVVERARTLAPEVAADVVGYPFEDFLGCLEPLTEAPPSPLPAGLADVELPSESSLIAKMPPVRDQGRRGTCVAHAATALREYLTRRQDCDLSEQFLYWWCKEHDGQPGDGTYLTVAMEGLLEAGICREADWPYNPNPVDGSEGQGPPPLGAERAAQEFRLKTSYCLVRRPGGTVAVRPFKAFLGGGSPRPVPFSVPLFDSFFNQATRRTGRVIMPLPGEEPRGGHAMCLVGYRDDENAPGGGFFIVRNSWGEGWAYNCEQGAGHALIPFAYIEQQCWEAYTGDAEPLRGATWAPRAQRTLETREARSPMDTGHCFACGKRMITQLDLAGRCTAPGCERPICNACWTVNRLRRCKEHEE